MTTIHDLASYFLCRAAETGELLTNLKLQKLVYYAQAWHLAVTGKPLFKEDFQAWVHGPVCPDLYHEYRYCRWQPIVLTSLPEEPTFAPESEEVLNQVVDLYLGESAYTLQRMTHSEDPWVNARKGLASDSPSNRIISQKSMKEYYENFIEQD